MFNYDEAFSRNLGWVSKEEQNIIANTKIAIAGAGGVGGIHALTLARMGFQHFHLADFDTFELVNFNRQFGATMSTLHQPKSEMLAKQIRDINPNAHIIVFNEGLTDHNLGTFMNADIFLDGLDAFAIDIRVKAYKKAQEKRVPLISCAPIGMGSVFFSTQHNRVDIIDFFDWQERDSEQELLVKFFAMILTDMHHLSYIKDLNYFNLQEQKGPSLATGCVLSAGIASAEILKIILKRPNVLSLPSIQYFDMGLNSHKVITRLEGNREDGQKILINTLLSQYIK